MSGSTIDMGGLMCSTFDEWGNISLGGLGGIPFAGNTGWEVFRHRAALQGKSDLLVVYGCDVHISADGEVVGGPSAMGAAFNAVDEANGIAGLDNSLLSDRHDQQMAHLLLEVAKVYESELVAHPDPFARLALANFDMVQTYLRQCINWTDLREGRLAALGGLTIHLPSQGSGDHNHGFAAGDEGWDAMHSGEPLYLPLAFEVFVPEDGALFDLLGDAMGTKGLHGEERREEGAQDRPEKRSQGPPRLHQALLFPLEEVVVEDEDEVPLEEVVVEDEDEGEDGTDENGGPFSGPPPSPGGGVLV
eukprot:CAMPEP_0171995708 /NCGR_PEP_ID=MMETSP0993-20121228/279606_1 /TAXON_ID=483369 /ORGANISM="non described non described, Strain CCMP2098" /LENGTH=303 /DNA_ID=CAMNT_0012648819 /DNA_START=252 /DNA_END=1162 /DNA_ORIENTATION=+